MDLIQTREVQTERKMEKAALIYISLVSESHLDISALKMCFIKLLLTFTPTI